MNRFFVFIELICQEMAKSAKKNSTVNAEFINVIHGVTQIATGKADATIEQMLHQFDMTIEQNRILKGLWNQARGLTVPAVGEPDKKPVEQPSTIKK